jgi:hypothetical protein
VEFGRSNDGPPNLVVTQPGLVVVPPRGLASNELIVLLFVAADEWSGVKKWTVDDGGAGDAPDRPAYASWVTSAPTPAYADTKDGSAWALDVKLTRVARPAVPEARARAVATAKLLRGVNVRN